MKNREWKWLCWLVLILVVGAQFVPVNRDNPAVRSDFAEKPEVKLVLQQSCYDCHSNESVWPWYSYVAPVSWLVATDVHEARKKVNFSDWGLMSVDKRRHTMNDIREEVEEGEMPLGKYLLLHSDAKLTEADKEILRAWTGVVTSTEEESEGE